jgi:hypothetical protein
LSTLPIRPFPCLFSSIQQKETKCPLSPLVHYPRCFFIMGAGPQTPWPRCARSRFPSRRTLHSHLPNRAQARPGGLGAGPHQRSRSERHGPYLPLVCISLGMISSECVGDGAGIQETAWHTGCKAGEEFVRGGRRGFKTDGIIFYTGGYACLSLSLSLSLSLYLSLALSLRQALD